MTDQAFTKALIEACGGSDRLLENESMKRHTSFQIGGPARYLVLPRTEGELIAVLKLVREQCIPYFIMGNGSNLLVDDAGFFGVVIKLAKNFSDIRVEGTSILAQAGALLSKIANLALANSLTGLEFASGIPGTLGGAVRMNAGAYGGEMKDVVVATRYLDETGHIQEAVGEEHRFGYRTSAFLKGTAILSSKLVLQAGNREEIEQAMRDFNARRREKQPLELPSAGSAFKRPAGSYASKLIDECGLRGFRVGGAQVSEKHCGFVVNTGNATCSDVIALFSRVKEIVFEKTGYQLLEEVQILKNES